MKFEFKFNVIQSAIIRILYKYNTEAICMQDLIIRADHLGSFGQVVWGRVLHMFQNMNIYLQHTATYGNTRWLQQPTPWHARPVVLGFVLQVFLMWPQTKNSKRNWIWTVFSIKGIRLFVVIKANIILSGFTDIICFYTVTSNPSGFVQY